MRGNGREITRITPSGMGAPACAYAPLYAPPQVHNALKCGHSPQAASDTIMRPMRPLSSGNHVIPVTPLSQPAAPMRPLPVPPQIREMPQCGHPTQAASDTIMRPMRPLSDTKKPFLATNLAASATPMPPHAPFPQLRKTPNCGHTRQSEADTTMRPTRPHPPAKNLLP